VLHSIDISMKWRPSTHAIASVVALSNLISACADEPCRDAPPSAQLEVIVDDVGRANAIRSLEVDVEIGEARWRRTFEISDELLDGKTSVVLELEPAPSTQFLLGVTIRAFGASEFITEARAEFSSTPDGCNRLRLDLTDTATVGARDAGSPVADAGVDLIDAGLPDSGTFECGDGVVEGAEVCDDLNTSDGDGCSGECSIEDGWGCVGAPSNCQTWWEAAFRHRRQITVRTGSSAPYNGFDGYTLRLTELDTAELIRTGKMQDDCSDLRIVWHQIDEFQELPRHVVACGSSETDVRFKSVTDLQTDDVFSDYFVYYGSSSAESPSPIGTTEVYLWHDDASVDRSDSYTHGRVDSWLDFWDDSLAWDPAGYYTYSTGNDYSSGYRRAVDERDVYVEAEFFHTGCFPTDMGTGVLVRGILTGGSTGTETASHYYVSARAHQESCGDGYAEDGDIWESSWRNPAIDGPNPPAIAINQWRKQGLAAWNTDPTELRFWDSNDGWPALGWPSGQLQAGGIDSDDHEQPGFVAVMTAQDEGRIRNVVVRRFTLPEPVTTLGAEGRTRGP
jgi:cysteine-rich repeat protein